MVQRKEEKREEKEKRKEKKKELYDLGRLDASSHDVT